MSYIHSGTFFIDEIMWKERQSMIVCFITFIGDLTVCEKGTNLKDFAMSICTMLSSRHFQAQVEILNASSQLV